ncbi:hypothetical protein SeMB42_g03733 [Synchytrium endobioticum]|uniref:NTF2 domain-containing protein n=1 Tax=Synchytrium endobioticum TaxID=286115 RepID=A0A507D4B9_9FUNG|nr:hypothetical protein SeMB42_g03733 [Synchytrium endobioticum]
MAATAPPTQVDINVRETKQPENSAAKATAVGWLFARQYYTFLNREPNSLHLFYKSDSQLTFGDESDQVRPRHRPQ